MKYKKGLTILLHITVWALFLSLPYFLRPNPSHFQNHQLHPPLPDNLNPLYFALGTNILMVPFFYLNLFVLFPKYILHKKYGTFISAQLLFILLIYLIKDIAARIILAGSATNRPIPEFKDFFFVFVYLFVTLLAFSYGMIRETLRKERLDKEREHESMKSELQFLRWQVNPHFLFNALNNMVSLARAKSDKLEPILIKLSTLMRYMLYETAEFKISLKKEVEYLESYIDLQKIRVGNNVAINVDLGTLADSEYTIEPMLLIPIIENAFKHGIGLVASPIIDIQLTLQNNLLIFKVKNKYIEERRKNKDDISGIGLSNLKRRLELLYRDKHYLDIKADEYYTVTLKIDLV